MIKTLSYVRGREEEIITGKEYYFGQLWEGLGDVDEILESGSIYVDDSCVYFEIIETNDDIMQTLVKVTEIA